MKELKVYYDNGYYKVVDIDYYDNVLEYKVQGYGVINDSTDVQEGEFRRLDVAKLMADSFKITTKSMKAGVPPPSSSELQ